MCFCQVPFDGLWPIGLDVCRCVSQGLLCAPLSPSELHLYGGQRKTGKHRRRFEFFLIVVIGKLHNFENHQNIKTSFFLKGPDFQLSVFRSVYNYIIHHASSILIRFSLVGDGFRCIFWSNLWPRTSTVSSPRSRRSRLQQTRSQEWLRFVASENLHFFQTELPWIAHGLHHFHPIFFDSKSLVFCVQVTQVSSPPKLKSNN